MEKVSLTLSSRSLQGKKVRLLRKLGLTPVHLYGPGIDSYSLECRTPDLMGILEKVGTHSPVTITVDGEGDEYLAFVRETQWEPVRGELLHVDFLRAELTRRMTAEVPLSLIGESTGAAEFGGTVVQYIHSLEVEALPLDIPAQLEIDTSALTDLESVLRARDVTLPEGVSLITAAGDPVARIEVAKEEEEVVEEEEMGEEDGAPASDEESQEDESPQPTE